MPVLKWSADAGDLFIRPILDHLSRWFDVVRDDGKPADLLWFDWVTDPLMEAARVGRGPIIARLHSFEARQRNYENIAWRNVAALIFVSDRIREYVESRYVFPSCLRVLTIPPGVDPDKFPMTEKVVGWVGHSPGKKGMSMFLELAWTVAGDPIRFLVAGDCEAAFAGCHVPPNVTFLGWQEDMAAFFHRCDFVLSCSEWEGTCQAVAEGISCGCIPILLEREWSRMQYPNSLRFSTAGEFVGRVMGRYRLDVPRQIDGLHKIEDLVRELCPRAL